MNGIGSYVVAGSVVTLCVATVVVWTPANTSTQDSPNFKNNYAPGMLSPNPPAQQPPGGSPIPSVEGNMPPIPAGDAPTGQAPMLPPLTRQPLPGLNTPPRSNPPAPTAPRPTLPPVLPTQPPVDQPPPANPCPIGLVVDPLLGICVRL